MYEIETGRSQVWILGGASFVKGPLPDYPKIILNAPQIWPTIFGAAQIHLKNVRIGRGHVRVITLSE